MEQHEEMIEQNMEVHDINDTQNNADCLYNK